MAERAMWCVVSRQPWSLWLELTEVERAALYAAGQKYGGM